MGSGASEIEPEGPGYKLSAYSGPLSPVVPYEFRGGDPRCLFPSSPADKNCLKHLFQMHFPGIHLHGRRSSDVGNTAVGRWTQRVLKLD